MNVKERILYWMKKKGIDSVNELALRSEMTQSTLQNIMTFPEREPRSITVKRICAGLGITVSEFWEETASPLNSLVFATIDKAESMSKSEDEKAALERLKAMPIDEQQRRVLAEYNKLTPEQRIAIDIIIRSLASSRQ